MNGVPGRGAWLASAVLLVLLVPSAASGAAVDEGWQVGGITRSSTWQEWDAQQRLLLTERGVLSGVMAGGAGRWQSLRWHVQGQLLSGGRRYDGQSSTGQALQTHTDLREAHVGLSVALPLGEAWQVGTLLQPTWLDRTLQGTSSAVGYREAWRWLQTEVQLQWQGAIGRSGLGVRASYGAALDGQLRLNLPGMDPATLRPAQGRVVRAELLHLLPLDRSGQADWSMQSGLQWQQLRFNASQSVPLTSGGVLRGGLSQPRTQARHIELQWSLLRRWP